MTAVDLAGSVGLEPSEVSIVFGIWRAIVCTFEAPSVLIPSLMPSAPPPACREAKGRRSPRSNTAPRSTKNASARWPANTFSPVARVLTAAAASDGEAGGDRGPMLQGGHGSEEPTVVEVPPCTLVTS